MLQCRGRCAPRFRTVPDPVWTQLNCNYWSYCTFLRWRERQPRLSPKIFFRWNRPNLSLNSRTEHRLNRKFETASSSLAVLVFPVGTNWAFIKLRCSMINVVLWFVDPALKEKCVFSQSLVSSFWFKICVVHLRMHRQQEMTGSRYSRDPSETYYLFTSFGPSATFGGGILSWPPFVCVSVFLLACRITQQVVGGFSWNLGN